MHLTSHTDYALRVLLFAGAAEKNVTINKISSSFQISKEHLRKVVHALSQHGFIQTSQGRHGGIKLALPPEEINLKEVVTLFEPMKILECFDTETNSCPISGMCSLKQVLFLAHNSFMETLAQYNLSDLIKSPKLIAFCQQ